MFLDILKGRAKIKVETKLSVKMLSRILEKEHKKASENFLKNMAKNTNEIKFSTIFGRLRCLSDPLYDIFSIVSFSLAFILVLVTRHQEV